MFVLFIVDFLAAKMDVSLLKTRRRYGGKWTLENFGHSMNYEWKKFYRATNKFYDTLSKKWSCFHAQAMIVWLWHFSAAGKTVKSNELPTFLWLLEQIFCCFGGGGVKTACCSTSNLNEYAIQETKVHAMRLVVSFYASFGIRFGRQVIYKESVTLHNLCVAKNWHFLITFK